MSNESTALVPIEEKEVDFYGDTIIAVLVDVEGKRRPEIYVPVRPITNYLGVSWGSQRNRIMRDQILSEEVKGVFITNTPGGRQEMLCLPVEMLHGWLFGISVNRVKEELQEKVLQYQRECYRVLWEAFQTDTLRALGQEPTGQQAALVQIAEMGRAITRLAEEQIELEDRVTDVEDLARGAHQRLDTAAKVIGNIMSRQDQLEALVAPGKPITQEQAAEISANVKALAQLLTEQDPSKNHYQGIFAELYRRFGVSSYKNIPATKYQDVMEFLEDWYKAAIGESQGEERRKLSEDIDPLE